LSIDHQRWPAEIGFQGWPKTPRLFRNITISEKIDGTHAAIGVRPWATIDPNETLTGNTLMVGEFLVYAQSRNRLITPKDDNYGFAAWVWDNAETLVADLGPGLHFGEWWGKGIQRGYGLDHKELALFNTHKWNDTVFATSNLGVVPVLCERTMDTNAVTLCLDFLRAAGSTAAPGFKPAEGVVVFHHQSRQCYKATLENDHLPKSEAA
jgi:RNA ligase-like protein